MGLQKIFKLLNGNDLIAKGNQMARCDQEQNANFEGRVGKIIVSGTLNRPNN